MTREDAKILLPIIQAYCEGKQIQWLKPDSDEWITEANLMQMW